MKYLLKNGKEIMIRDAEEDDARNLIEYVKKIIPQSDNLTFEKGEFTLTVEGEKQFISSINSTTNQCFLLAFSGDEIIGNLCITSSNRAKLKHSGEMSITVTKKYWNQGTATCLMKELTKWLETSTLRKVNLSVKEDNKNAIKLYEKFGFKQEGVISRGFLIADEFYSLINMGKIVD
ncbi:MAG: N-acetyltransferase family protein [Sphaerochaeta sp.]